MKLNFHFCLEVRIKIWFLINFNQIYFDFSQIYYDFNPIYFDFNSIYFDFNQIYFDYVTVSIYLFVKITEIDLFR